jgi:hypothetical protein
MPFENVNHFGRFAVKMAFLEILERVPLHAARYDLSVH